MRVVGPPKSFYQLSKKVPPDLDGKAQDRMRWVSGWNRLRQRGVTASEAAEALGLSRCSLYRWDKALGYTVDDVVSMGKRLNPDM